MSATRCTCIRLGLTVVVPDEGCRAAIIHITHPARKATPA